MRLRLSSLAATIATLAGIGCGWWWAQQGPLGPWLVIGLMSFLAVAAFAAGCQMLKKHPSVAGRLMEGAGFFPVLLALALMTASAYELLIHAPEAGASPRVSMLYGALSAAVGTGIVALVSAFDPLGSPDRDHPGVFEKKVRKTFQGRFTSDSGGVWRDAVSALTEWDYSLRAGSGRSVRGWGRAERRERMRTIQRAVDAPQGH